MTPQASDWRYLAEQASKETDPAKLLTIVEVLNRVLEIEKKRSATWAPKGHST
jgi:hypothetical protein